MEIDQEDISKEGFDVTDILVYQKISSDFIFRITDFMFCYKKLWNLLKQDDIQRKAI
jgi:hypothetical protein